MTREISHELNAVDASNGTALPSTPDAERLLVEFLAALGLSPNEAGYWLCGCVVGWKTGSTSGVRNFCKELRQQAKKRGKRVDHLIRQTETALDRKGGVQAKVIFEYVVAYLAAPGFPQCPEVVQEQFRSEFNARVGGQLIGLSIAAKNRFIETLEARGLRVCAYCGKLLRTNEAGPSCSECVNSRKVYQRQRYLERQAH